MANNYYTRFALTTTNTLTDDALSAYLNDGIEQSSVAYSNVLNGILRQTSTIAWSLAEFVKDQTNTDVGSDNSDFDVTDIEAALDTWVSLKGYAVSNILPFEKAAGIDAGQPAKLKVWWGTQAQYDALTPAGDTLYYILQELNMEKKLPVLVKFEEIDYGLTEEERLLEILGLHGYFDDKGIWHDAKE